MSYDKTEDSGSAERIKTRELKEEAKKAWEMNESAFNAALFKLKLQIAKYEETVAQNVRAEEIDGAVAQLSVEIDQAVRELTNSEVRGYTDLVSAWNDMLKLLRSASLFLHTLLDNRPFIPLLQTIFTSPVKLLKNKLGEHGKVKIEEPTTLDVHFDEKGGLKFEADFEGIKLTQESLQTRFQGDKKGAELAVQVPKILEAGITGWAATKGYTKKDGVFIHAKTHKPLTQEIFDSLNKDPKDPGNLENFLSRGLRTNMKIEPHLTSGEEEVPSGSIKPSA